MSLCYTEAITAEEGRRPPPPVWWRSAPLVQSQPGLTSTVAPGKLKPAYRVLRLVSKLLQHGGSVVHSRGYAAGAALDIAAGVPMHMHSGA